MGISPTSGNNLRLYVQEGDSFAGAPEIWIIFQVSGESVEIIAVNFLQSAADELDQY
jgi:hypothetical protein